MKAYKGFGKDMKCLDYQYEEGKTYETGEAKLCKSGFHACELPLDCMNYYAPNDSVYYEVDLDGVTGEKDKDSKVCGTKIKIGARLSIAQMVKAEIEILKEKVKPTTGDYAHAATTGNHAHAATTGCCAHAATTGDYAHAATTGDYAHAATTGNHAHAATTGYYAHAATTGDYAYAEANGKNSVAVSIGINSVAKAAIGNWIVLAEYDTKDYYKLLCVKTAMIDGETYKPDVWYKLVNGEIVEA